MNHIIRAPVKIRHQTRLRLVQVVTVQDISPRMRRVTFEGPDLHGFESLSPDDHVKLFFPREGQDRPDLPVTGPDGLHYPDSAVRPETRDYTPRRFDAQARRLVIEFVVHGAQPLAEGPLGEGAGSRWAAQAAPGQWIGVAGPKSSTLIAEDYDSYLLVGDETALPAMSRFLEEMAPGVRALVLIEAADAREFRKLPSAANAEITWLYRDGSPAGQSGLLETALRALMLPDGATHAWLAGEIETVRRLRAYLLAEEGFSKSQIRAAGYWRLGEAGAHTRLED